MLRRIIFIIVVLCSPAASAQWRYGFNFGGSIADGRLSSAEGYSLVNRSAFRGGLTFEFQIPPSSFPLAFDASLLYNRYNCRLRNADGEVLSFGRNYLEVPLNIKYKFWLSRFSNLFAPMILTGPSFIYRLDGNDRSPLKAKRFQPGWNFGVGIDIINFIQLTASYRLAFGNAARTFDARPDAKFRSNCWTVSAVILFDF